MKRIYIRKIGERNGRVFKSKYSIINDRISILPFSFIVHKIITDKDVVLNEKISDKFNFYISEKEIDGRSKLASSLNFFSWSNVFKINKIK